MHWLTENNKEELSERMLNIIQCTKTVDWPLGKLLRDSNPRTVYKAKLRQYTKALVVMVKTTIAKSHILVDQCEEMSKMK